MANNLRFGVVGLGMGMNRSGVIHDTDGAELVAVADLVEERRKTAEERFGCESHDDALEMFDRDEYRRGNDNDSEWTPRQIRRRSSTPRQTRHHHKTDGCQR